MKTISLFITALFIVAISFAQTPQASDLMFKKEITRAIDLREKQNEPLYSAGKEISKLLMDATLSGQITPYTSDSLKEGATLSFKEFQQRITLESDFEILDTAYMDYYEKIDYLEALANREETNDYFFGKDLYQLEMKEIIYFSKKSSEMRHQIKSLTIFLPAEHPDNPRGIQQAIATYDYTEVMKVFKNDPNAIWYNPYNDAEHRTLAEAFDLRLFSSYITKISNPNDEFLSDIYRSERQGVIQAQETEYKLLEYESNLWEN